MYTYYWGISPETVHTHVYRRFCVISLKEYRSRILHIHSDTVHMARQIHKKSTELFAMRYRVSVTFDKLGLPGTYVPGFTD